jgi:hypothetical protein
LELYERDVVKHITTKSPNQSKYDLAVGSISWQYFEAEKRPSTTAMFSFVVFTSIEVSDFIDL